jgi:hypothetical protein
MRPENSSLRPQQYRIGIGYPAEFTLGMGGTAHANSCEFGRSDNE